MKKENIVVLDKLEMFEYTGWNLFNGFKLIHPDYNNALQIFSKYTFKERNQKLENNPNYKQIIPYTLIKFIDRESNEYYLTYERKSGGNENRLHNLKSVGFGGHMNKIDSEPLVQTELLFDHFRIENNKKNKEFLNLLINNIYKELVEEIVNEEYLQKYTTIKFNSLLFGLINDVTNSVGRVHYGLVNLIVFRDLYCDRDGIIDINKERDKIGNVAWKTLEEINEEIDYYENWSKLVLTYLIQM